MQRAFTLIELLVVIAIIAILAAILFPVFARAKLAAKKTAALSQVKQLGTAVHIYQSDFDDYFPHVSQSGPNDAYRIDWWWSIDPYVKNGQMFFSSERTEKGCQLVSTTSDSPARDREQQINKEARCMGYGYNWGAQIYAGGGLLEAVEPMQPSGTLQRGINATSADEPANLFVYGDTYDTPRYTIGMYPNSAGGKAWILDTFNVTTATRQGNFRFGGRFNMAYADGHAKNVQYRGGLTTGVGYAYVPASPRDRLAYCANPDKPLDGSLFGAGTIACRDFVALPETRGTTWSPN